MSGYRLVIDWQIRVAVKHEEIVRQFRQQLLDGPPSTQEFFPIVGISDVDSKPFSVSKKFLDHLTQISNTKKNLGDAVRSEKSDLMFQKWTPSNFNQAFRNLLRQRPQTSRKTTGEDDDWK